MVRKLWKHLVEGALICLSRRTLRRGEEFRVRRTRRRPRHWREFAPITLAAEVQQLEARTLLSGLTDTTPATTQYAAPGASTGNVVLATFTHSATFSDLNPGGISHALAISGSNVVGNYQDDSLQSHGFLFNGTTYTTIDPAGTASTTATGVSGNIVVGNYSLDGNQLGFEYDAATATYTTVDPPGAPYVNVNAVSGSNVVGTYADNSGTHGFLYDGTTYTTLDDPSAQAGGTTPTAVDGNNVVGNFTDNSGNTHGFLYNGTTYTTLDAPGATFTQATAVSGGNIVGNYDDASGQQHGFEYDGSTFTTIDPSTSIRTVVQGISGNEVVGHYRDPNHPFGQLGFVYDGTTFTTLDDPSEGTGTLPIGISEGSIIGFYGDGNGFPNAFIYQQADVPASDFTPTVDWGGAVVGTPTVSVQLVSQSDTVSTWQVVGKATYAEAGTFTPSVSVTDVDGESLQSNNTTFNVGLTDTTPATTQDAVEGSSTGNVVLATFTDPNPTTFSDVNPGGLSHALAISGSNVVGNYTNYGDLSLRSHGFLFNGTTYTTIDPVGTNSTTATGVSGSIVVGNFNLNGNQLGFEYDAATATYTTVDPPGASYVTVNAVSGGDVVGTYADNSGGTHGFLYNGTTYTTLDDPSAQAGGTTPAAIDGNDVVGAYLDSSGHTHGFLYNGTTYTTLDAPGATFTQATAVSGGNIVGYYDDASGRQHGFEYKGSTFTTIEPSTSIGTVVEGVSGNVVVGHYRDPNHHSGQLGFVYDGSTFTTLDDPSEATGTIPIAISGGSIVGFYGDGNGFPNAFIYQKQVAPVSNFTPTVDWGGAVVGTPTVSVQLVSQSATVSTWQVVGKATYAESGTFTPGVSIADVDGESLQSSRTTFNVADAALFATATPVTTAVFDTQFSGEVATFVDANPAATLADFPLANVTIQWGDGSTSNATAITQPGGPGTAFHVFGTHMYGAAGATATPLSVTIADVDGSVSNTTSYAVTVAKANATIVVNPYSVTYDASAHMATYTVTGVGADTTAAGSSLTLNTTHTNAGTYSGDTWSFSGGNNYNDIAATTITDVIFKATAKINVTPYSVTYDSNAHTATGTASGVGGVDLSAGLNLTRTTHTNAGTNFRDSWSFHDAGGNYQDAASGLSDRIGKANATVVVTPYNVTYDAAAHTAAHTVVGVGSDKAAAGSTLTLNTTHTNAGTYSNDKWSFSGGNNYNNIAATTITDVIGQAQADIEITPYSATYNANAHTATGTATGVGGVDLSAGLNLTGTTHTNAGTYPSDAWSFHDASGNYHDASGTVSEVIGQAAADIAVTPYAVTYDSNSHTATGTATGVDGVDLSAGLDLTGTTHTNAGTYASDTWSFHDAAGNYQDASGTVTDSVGQAAAKIAITPYSVTYDASAHAATGTATGVRGVDLSAGLTLSGTTHTDAGTYASDAWSFHDAAGNYQDASGTVSESIGQATANIVVTPYGVTYDSSSHTASGTAAGVGGVDLSASLNLTGTTHTNAGTYASDAWSFHDASGNYQDASGTVSDAIAKANATVVVTPYNVTYDANSHSAAYAVTGVGSDTSAAGSSVTLNTTHTNAGTYANDSWSFSGGNNYNDIAATTITDVIGGASTTTTLSSSLGTSGFGQSVTFTAVVTSSAPGIPTGRVDFYDGSTLIGSGNLTVVNGQDQATVSTSALADGVTHSITAVYSGDGNDQTSTSAALAQSVLSAQQQSAALISQVNALVSSAVLTSGNGNALTSILNNAITNLNSGNKTAGVNQLNACINKVQAFQKSGKLSVALADDLIAAVNQAIASATA